MTDSVHAEGDRSVAAAAINHSIVITGDYNVVFNHASARRVDSDELDVGLQRLALLPLDTLPAPALLPTPHRMLFSRNPHFIGREVDLQNVGRLFKLGNLTVIVAVSGIGGVGKTEFASEFVHRYGQFFSGVFWLNFAHPNTIAAEIADCGGVGSMNIRPDFGSLSLADQVAAVASEWKNGLPYLLVLDNCEDEALLNQWLPTTGNCRVLVTSRRVMWDDTLAVQPYQLQMLSRNESIALLRQYRPELPNSDTDLNEIAGIVGDMPLALTLAGRFLKMYKDDTLPAAYVQELRQSHELAHESLEGEGISPRGNTLSIDGTIRLSYDRLDVKDQHDALALQLIARAAHFAPSAPFPRNLLKDTLQLHDNRQQTIRRLSRAITHLINLGLLETAAESRVRMHPLVAAFVRRMAADPEAKTAVEQTMYELAERLNNEGYPGTLLALQPHLRAITDAATRRQDILAVGLCTVFGTHLKMIGDYATARAYYEQALIIMGNVEDDSPQNIAAIMSNLGSTLQAQGKYELARSYLEQALAINQLFLGATHSETATTLGNLAALLEAQGDYADVQTMYEQALAIDKINFGADHPKVAAGLNNLGTFHYRHGNNAEAKDLFDRALRVYEQTRGANHPDTGRVFNNLGLLLQAEGQLERAQDYYERALLIREQALGKEHPDVLITVQNIGYLLQARGDFSSALPLYQRVLDAREQQLGKMHPLTAAILSNIGTIRQELRDYHGARSCYEQALSIRLEVLGPEHPDTAESLWCFGRLFTGLGKLQRANEYFERAFAVFQRSLGVEHPKTLQCQADFSPEGVETREAALVIDIEQHCTAHVGKILTSGNREQRTVLANRLEQQADLAEEGEQDGSRFAIFAATLRGLAMQLRSQAQYDNQNEW